MQAIECLVSIEHAMNTASLPVRSGLGDECAGFGPKLYGPALGATHARQLG